MPTLILRYLKMIFYLNYFEPKYKINYELYLLLKNKTKKNNIEVT